MFLTPRHAGATASGRRERSDHATVEDAKNAYDQHPQKTDYEALIYVDGAPAWVGVSDWNGRVEWQPWAV